MVKTKKQTQQQITEKLRKKCVALAKIKAKEKAGYCCEFDGCGLSKELGYQMHGAHIYGEGAHKAMSADVDNIICLCANHHTGGFFKNYQGPSWHESPKAMVNWFDRKFPERAKELEKRAYQKFNDLGLKFWENKYQELKNDQQTQKTA